MIAISHVWFDLDGTLYRKTISIEKRIRRALTTHIAQQTGLSYAEVRREYRTQYRSNCCSHSRVFQEFGLNPRMVQEVIRSVQINKFISEDKKLSRIFELLDSENTPYSIYSNNRRDTIEDILNALKVDKSQFSTIITGDSYSKTEDNAGFRYALEYSKAIEERRRRNHGYPYYHFSPRRVVFVGDRDEVELKPAKNLGMTTLPVWANKDSQIATRTFPDIYSITNFLQEFGYLG